MKQGRASSARPEGRKMEPSPRAVSPGGADALGQHFGNHADTGDFRPRLPELYQGRGFEAPAIRNTTAKKGGSQGRY